jgi:hypothetical protein
MKILHIKNTLLHDHASRRAGGCELGELGHDRAPRSLLIRVRRLREYNLPVEDRVSEGRHVTGKHEIVVRYDAPKLSVCSHATDKLIGVTLRV